MADFNHYVMKWYPTGSRFICSPSPTDTDNDTVIWVANLEKAAKALVDDDWQLCGGEEYTNHDGVVAYRKGIENYIITQNPSIFGQWVFATNAAKVLNLTKKEDRIKLFAKIFEGAVGKGPNSFQYAEWDEQVLFP